MGRYVDMVRLLVFLSAAVFMSACGGTPEPSNQGLQISQVPPNATRFATGPIGTACLIHDRAKASRARCGCIQAAADQTLSQSQQQRSVRYFSEPGLLQEVRQSDNPANERFWQAWKVFSGRAEALCQGT